MIFLNLLIPAGFTGAFASCSGAPADQKPNLIVIMVDDMGYSDVGFNGCKDIPTPNIDRIANEGVRFSNGYVTYSVCSPSRAGFITGRYPQRFGYERNVQYRPDDPDMGLSKDEMTLAGCLGQVGYHSGIIGKWHMGAHISNHPLNRGFDEFYGHLGGGHQYFPEMLTIPNGYEVFTELESYRTWIMRNHDHEPIDEYLTDEFSNEAVSFVERNAGKPFFLYLAYNAPHAPLQATEKYLSRFPDMKEGKRKTYAAMVSAVDDGVGRVLDKIEELGIAENTLVFFLSDNGGPETKNGSDNGPLREGKGSIYEGGFHVPFAFMWKGKLEPGVYESPVSSMDIFATITSLAQAPLNPGHDLDGVNLIPFLKGERKDMPHENIFLRKYDNRSFAVRHGDLKLVTTNWDAHKELYNLRDDIGEEVDIASKYPDELNRIDSIRANWNEQLMDPAFLGLIHTDAWKKKAGKEDEE